MTLRCAAAAVVSAVVLRRPTKEYTHRYSMMHRRLTTAGIEVAPHYHHQLHEQDTNDTDNAQRVSKTHTQTEDDYTVQKKRYFRGEKLVHDILRRTNSTRYLAVVGRRHNFIILGSTFTRKMIKTVCIYRKNVQDTHRASQ